MYLSVFLVEECAANGTYISLVNHSASKCIDVSRWVLKRRVAAAMELRYTLPDGVQLQQGGELRIYSKLGADTADAESSSYQKLVANDLASWGTRMPEVHLSIRSSLLLISRYGSHY